jgi:hypothetical protein
MKTYSSLTGLVRTRFLSLIAMAATLWALSSANAQVRLVVGSDVRLAESIHEALDLLNEVRRAGNDAPAEVLLENVVYAIDRPIVIDQQLAGEGLVIRSADEPATISGGVEITGWRGEGDVWVTRIDAVAAGAWWFEGLYVSGERRPIARFPNDGWLRVAKAGPDKRTSFASTPGDLPSDLGPDGLRIVFLHDWSSSIIDVREIDHDNDTLYFVDPIGPNAPHYRIDNFEPHPRYRLEGSRQLLDEPGEWSLDRPTGVLTYRPMAGETIGETRVFAPRLETLVRIEGVPNARVRNVTFRNIRFAHTNWNIPEHGYAEGQAAFYERRVDGETDGSRLALPAAITMKWAEECAIENCLVESLGASGVWIGEGCAESVISETIVRDVAGNGVMVGETQTRRVEGKPWWQAAPEQAASGIVVRDCLIERCGQRFAGAVGLWVGLAQRTTIAYNEVRDLPYTGVSLGWMWNPTPTPCRENVVEGNHIHDVMQVLSDGGGIYVLGFQPGTALRNNEIHGVRANAGRAPSNGMFIDEGSTDLLITGNTIWDTDRTPIRFHKAGRNMVRENVFVLGEAVEIAQYNRTDPADIAYVENVTPEASAWSEAMANEAISRAGPRQSPGLTKQR